MNNKTQKIILIIVISITALALIGGTFAYWYWSTNESDKTSVTLTYQEGLSCTADGGGNITSQEKQLIPATCTNDTYTIIKPVTVTTTADNANEIINLNLSLKIDKLDSVLAGTQYFKYALSDSEFSCDTSHGTGNFYQKQVGDTVPLLTNKEFIGSETKTYYLYIWLDKDETDNNTMNKEFSLSLTGSCTDSGNIKKYYAYFGNQTQYFKASPYKDNITSISIANNMNIPANAAASWNLGVSPSNEDDVKGWLEDDGSGNNTFALKIGADGQIFANNSMVSAFYNMRKVSSINLDGLNTINVNSMGSMFYQTGYSATDFSLNLGSQFNTSNVKRMDTMFYQTGYSATDFSLNLGSQFNTSNVNIMSTMFGYAGYSAKSFNLNLGSQFNTSNVNTMAQMFSKTGYSATDFSLNLGSQFNTSNVNTMSSMFENTGYSATDFSLNLGSQFNTSNVNNMAHMFSNTGRSATSFNLDLGSQFNTSNVNNTDRMFYNMGRSTLTNFTLDLAAGDFNKVTNNTYMFRDFPGNKATIYVKDSNAQNFIISQNTSMFNTNNVKIKGSS